MSVAFVGNVSSSAYLSASRTEDCTEQAAVPVKNVAIKHGTRKTFFRCHDGKVNRVSPDRSTTLTLSLPQSV